MDLDCLVNRLKIQLRNASFHQSNSPSEEALRVGKQRSQVLIAAVDVVDYRAAFFVLSIDVTCVPKYLCRVLFFTGSIDVEGFAPAKSRNEHVSGRVNI